MLGDRELVRVDDVAVEGLVDGRHDLHEVLVHGRTSTGIYGERERESRHIGHGRADGLQGSGQERERGK